MKTQRILLAIVTLTLFACGNKKEESKVENKITIDTVNTPIATEEKASELITDSTEIKLKNFMIKDYIKDDIKLLMEADHQFQFENVDLNGDTIPETFVRFSSPYYCGSGGCTFLLLDNKQKMITKFTVMDAPIFVEKTVKNGWSILLVKDHGILKELVFNEKKYPYNPSVLPKAPYDAPSSETTVLFDKPFAESKISVF